MEKLVTTMTSWEKRISNCYQVINNILQSTLQPDIIYLNLSSDEFLNLTSDLPNDLAQLCMTNSKIKLNWIPGRNTKSMKKLMPILKYLQQNDLVMTIDDDMIVSPDLIKSRYDDFISNEEQYCITTHDRYLCGNNLFSRKMLNGYELFLTDEIINTGNDDCFYTLMLYLNGYNFKCGSDYTIKTCQQKSKHILVNWYQNNDSLWRNGSTNYSDHSTVKKLFETRAEYLFHKKWCDLFGVFREYNSEHGVL